MSFSTNQTTQISKVETENWVETTSEPDEIPKEDKCLSPMSITPEVTSGDEWEKKNNRILELEMKTKRFDELKKDMKKSRAKISILIKEKKRLGRKLAELKDPSLTVKSNSKSNIKVLESELKSWEEKRKIKEMQTKELWRTIQTQDDMNVKLKLDAEEWKDREIKMNDELMLLKKALENCKNNKERDEDFFLSTTTDDWKSRLESDLNRCQKGSGKSFQSTKKFKGQQQKRVMKFGALDLPKIKNCKKSSSRGYCGKEDKSPRKRRSKDPRLTRKLKINAHKYARFIS